MVDNYVAFQNMKLDYKHCFLCGIKLEKKNTTDEHVIPTWLQHRHQLWNQKLSLRNKTNIPYRKLKIPCCDNCNNVYLADIEKKIEKGSVSYEEFIKLDRQTIFLWLVKLYYGLLFKDLSLIADFKDRSKGTLISEEELSNCRMLHEFLQSARIDTQYNKEVFSLFIFKIHLDTRRNPKYDFYFTDDNIRSQLAIQIGEIGIICCIGEDGIIEENFKSFVEPFKQYTLHGIQFREFIAKVFYLRECLLVTPTYLLLSGLSKMQIVSNLSPLSGEYFRDTDFKEFGAFLAYYLKYFGVTFDQLYDPELDAVITFLLKENGNLHLLDEDGSPLPDMNIKHCKHSGELYRPNFPK
ncbi:hypothetical protein AM232_18815 [Bacillus sp. FJAT-21352]|nr:hypothetical protein AM232_18815 [Bacillus sp. FJAT-21352]